MRRSFVFLAPLALAVAGAVACTPAPQSGREGQIQTPAAALTVADGWAGVTPGGARVGAGYLTIANSGAADDLLVSAQSPRAAHVEIHETQMRGDMMTMTPAAGGVVIPAHGSVEFRPGERHLMFIDITAPFAPGETVPVTLTFKQAGAIETSLSVRPAPAP
jgi:hypothetical protein